MFSQVHRFKRTLERRFWISGWLSTPPPQMFAAVQAGSFLSFLSCSFGRQLSIQPLLHHIVSTWSQIILFSLVISALFLLGMSILGFWPLLIYCILFCFLITFLPSHSKVQWCISSQQCQTSFYEVSNKMQWPYAGFSVRNATNGQLCN